RLRGAPATPPRPIAPLDAARAARPAARSSLPGQALLPRYTQPVVFRPAGYNQRLRDDIPLVSLDEPLLAGALDGRDGAVLGLHAVRLALLEHRLREVEAVDTRYSRVVLDQLGARDVAPDDALLEEQCLVPAARRIQSCGQPGTPAAHDHYVVFSGIALALCFRSHFEAR